MSAECGTSAGYQRHRRADETACDECKAAQREYIRGWRTQRGLAASSRRLERARKRAQTRLAAMYPDVFSQLLGEELAAQRESA